MHSIIVTAHILICAGLIGFILVQHGKGAEAGAAFGSGASATVFGSRGSGSFLTQVTSILAAAFFVTSLTLAYFSTATQQANSVTEMIQTSPVTGMPSVELATPSTVSDLPTIPAQ
ncbi:preprotein translocase subunit SecG [Candidatus Albibeggiatoa sp. nov. BB20]|uniref:preprotein translocase subunit SecG n=1 Tax=Candidatus Albibeggiatoa sp. nov. BB20 TaxID=3162723 RepID=UPI0033654119